jgi:hypothetical protein
MPEEISLKEAEKRAFTGAFQDGLWDILIGFYLLLFVLVLPLSRILGDFWSSLIMVPCWGLAFLAVHLIRKRVVIPRVGRVRPGAWRKARLVRFNAAAFVVLVVAFGLGVLSFVQFDAVPGWVHSARFALSVLIVFGLAAYSLNVTRLYLYGILAAAAPLVGEVLWTRYGAPHHGFPITFGITSAIIMGTGLVHFIRLLREPTVTGDLTTLGEEN